MITQDKGQGLGNRSPFCLSFCIPQEGAQGLAEVGTALGARSRICCLLAGLGLSTAAVPIPHIPGARIAEEFRLKVSSAEHRLTAGIHQFLGEIPELH